MTESVSLIPVRAAEMALGKPLPWPVYDWHGNLLLASGFVVENQTQLDGLIENGFFHDSSWDVQGKQADATSESKTVAAAAAPTVPDAKEVMIDMDDVRWSVGETLYLQLHGNPTIRYTVRMIGYVKNKTVFVTAPSLDGKFEFIREGQTFVVRAFSGKKAYAFIASAVKAVHAPHPYLHLSYPKQVRCTVVRKGARAAVKIIAAITLGMPEQSAAGVLTDMSVGGASGILKEPFGSKGDEGKVVFKVRAAENDEYLSLKAILRSITPSEQGDGFRHGFEFVDVSMRDRLILSAFVHQTLVETD